MNSICRKVSVVIIAITMLAAMIPAMQENVFAAKAKKPAKVKKVEISVAEDNSVTVTWKKSKNAKKYVVSVKDGSTKLTSTKKVKSAKLTFQGGNDIKYTIKVRGINGKKKGKWSKAASVTTVDLLADANEAVAKAEADKKAAEEAVAKAEADKKAAEEALAKAEADLKAAQDTAKEAGEADKKAAEEAVAKAETDKQAAEDALQEANNKLAAAEQDKKQAVEDAVKEAEEAKKQAEADKKAAEDALEEVEKELGSTKADKEKAEEDLKKANDDLRDANDAREKAEKELADFQKVTEFKDAWNAAPVINETSTAEEVAAKKAAAELFDALTDDQKALLSDELKADVEAQKTAIKEREEVLRPKTVTFETNREFIPSNVNAESYIAHSTEYPLAGLMFKKNDESSAPVYYANTEETTTHHNLSEVVIEHDDTVQTFTIRLENYSILTDKPDIYINDVKIPIDYETISGTWVSFDTTFPGVSGDNQRYRIQSSHYLQITFGKTTITKDVTVRFTFNEQ